MKQFFFTYNGTKFLNLYHTFEQNIKTLWKCCLWKKFKNNASENF